MYVTHLQLTGFRSYQQVSVALRPGVTVLVGQNGQGKTNLVEAIDYLATLGSHRVSSDAPLVRAGASQATVSARVQAGLDDPRALSLDLEINPGRANRARLNRAPLKRPRDLLGALVVVLFSPEDLAIVKADPAGRRRFLDDLLVSRWPRLAGVRQDYERVLKQRNVLLKSLSGRSLSPAGAGADSTLDAWSDHLALLGAELVCARLQTLAELGPHLERQYAQIAPVNSRASARYESSSPVEAGMTRDDTAQLLRGRMQQRRREEIARGVSLVGPHRDDLHLVLGELAAKGYASHGESWSLALALRLASYHLLRGDGIEPVLVLDDVFAELDQTRRQRLAGSIADAQQVLITAAVADDVPAELGGRRLVVADGQVYDPADGEAPTGTAADASAVPGAVPADGPGGGSARTLEDDPAEGMP